MEKFVIRETNLLAKKKHGQLASPFFTKVTKNQRIDLLARDEDAIWNYIKGVS